MGRPSARHDGEFEAAMYRGVSSAARTLERHRGHHAHLPPFAGPRPLPYSPAPSSVSTPRCVPSRRCIRSSAPWAPRSLAAIIITHDLRTNHEVLVRKETRRMQVCTPEEDPAAYDRLVGLARKSYDHGLRRSLLGYKPWVFSRFQEWASGVSREDCTVDLSREKWTLEQSRRGLLSERPPPETSS